MNTSATTVRVRVTGFDAEARHRLRWRLAVLIAVSALFALAVDGYSFYRLPMAERVHDADYALLRPSGSRGLNLGIVGGILFLMIYAYAIRKRVPWLRKIGNTKHWLDYHVLFGLLAPTLITLHSTFRFHGIAGMAFWVMWAVAASGVAGRYIYAQIPRRISASELNIAEMEAQRAELSRAIAAQNIFSPAELERVTTLPSTADVSRMPLAVALFAVLALDVKRPFQVSALRRRSMSPFQQVISLGGLLPLGNKELEQVAASVREQNWLSTKLLFLGKAQRLFHMWHVVHRPFSYSFMVLVIVHIGFVIFLGHF